MRYLVLSALFARVGDFANAQDLAQFPAGCTQVQVDDSDSRLTVTPLPVPPTPRAWLERLSPATQAAIAAAGASNPTILLWLLKAAGTPAIDVTASETIAGVGALVTAGIITTTDQTTLLTP